jgi:hypothetical protein
MLLICNKVNKPIALIGHYSWHIQTTLRVVFGTDYNTDMVQSSCHTGGQK